MKIKSTTTEALSLGWLAASIWTLVLAGSLWWNLQREAETTHQLATAEARANHAKDLSFRRWATGHGGVYVPLTPTQPPVPWLTHLPESLVTTTDGQKLVLLNPASMLRQVMDRFSEDYGVRGRITGLKYLNPANAPDEWERQKMLDFERGLNKEVTEEVNIDGKPYLRYLKAMYMENEGCVRCHAVLGFTRIGEFRGAIGVNIPLETYRLAHAHHRLTLAVSHGGIWLLGLAGIGVAYRQRARYDREKNQSLKDLTESEARFRAIVETSPMPMLITGLPPLNEVMLMNHRFVEVFGYTDRDVRNVDDWWPLAYPDAEYRAKVVQRWTSSVAAMQARNARRIDPVAAEVRCKDGNRRYVEVHMALSGDRALIVFHDLTERKRLEDELKSLNAHLEDHVADRTASLTAAVRDLEAFSYSVSHDLRTPLRAINGFSELLIEDERDKLSDAGRDMLDRIARSANRMGQLIDDILEYSRSGRQAMLATDIDLADLARKIAGDMAELYPATLIDIQTLPTVRGDMTMLTQVLQNLIGNALKFSAKRETPRVAIGMQIVDGETAYFVRDNGTGFDMQYAGKLFGMFQRMHTDNQYPGTGVGLAIVKRLIERHNGRIWAEAEPDRGATFYFTLGSLRE